jgi:hypothetical protein
MPNDMPRRAREVSPFERLCRELGVAPHRVLQELRENGLVPTGVDVDVLDRRALARAREAARAIRMQTRTSKLWVAGYADLVREWHPTKNGDVFPDEVRFGSHLRIWWKCAKGPDHEWQARPNGRTSGRGCPFCAGQRVSVTNSLATLRKDLAAIWHSTKNAPATPQLVTAQSHKTVWWRCRKDASHEWRSAPVATTGCPYCAGKRISRARTLHARAPLIAREWHPKKNEQRPDEVFAGSQQLAWWRCERGHEWQATVRNRALRDHGCPTCAHRPPEEDDSLAAARPDLAQQWHPANNGSLRPTKISCGSPRRVWWRCAVAEDHEWQTAVANRVAGRTGCPFCANQRVSRTNSLATQFPVVAAEWHPSRNGKTTPSNVVAGSSRAAWWRCAHGHVWRTRIAARSRLGTGCPRCATARRAQRCVLRYSTA